MTNYIAQQTIAERLAVRADERAQRLAEYCEAGRRYGLAADAYMASGHSDPALRAAVEDAEWAYELARRAYDETLAGVYAEPHA